ncbi:MAG: VanZ family protein [Hydrogenophilales bacterium]|nr:VanZ family protein [Hydrogenophilales bacterium]
MRLRYHRTWLALGGLWIAIVIIFSLMPNPPDPLSFEQSDKLSHFLAYGWLMFWFCQLYSGTVRWGLALSFIALGVGLEFVQSLTPDRAYEALDMAANAGGVLLGWLLAATPLAQGLHLIETRYLMRSA